MKTKTLCLLFSGLIPCIFRLCGRTKEILSSALCRLSSHSLAFHRLLSPSIAFRRLLPLLAAFLSLPSPSVASISPTINYQGYIVSKTNNLPVDLSQDIKFVFYNVPAGGAPIFTESRCGVPVAKGRYEVEIGSMTAGGIPAAVFQDNASIWLEIQIDPDRNCSGVYEALSPRMRIQAAGYAFESLHASTAAYVSAGAINSSAQIADGTVYGQDIANSTITLNKLNQSGCALNEIPKWNGSNWACGADNGVGAESDPYSIHIQDTLQAGATFYVSSGTVNTFYVGTSISLPDDSIQVADIGPGTLPTDVLASSVAANGVRPGSILAGAIVNADINNAADIAISKLATSGSLGGNVIVSSIAVGAVNSSNQIVDGTIANADLAGSIDDAKLNTIATAGKVSDSALSSNVALLNANQLISGVKTFSSTATITGQDASGYSLKLSSGMLATGGTITAGLFVGSGAGLTGVTGATDNTKVLKTGDFMSGQLTVTGSSITAVNTLGTDLYSLAVTTSADRSVYHLLVSTTGNVGIGNSNPSYRGDVNGSFRVSGAQGGASSGAGIEMHYDSGNNKGQIYAYDRTAGSAKLLTLQEAGGDINLAANKMFINGTNGNVGIGTMNPNSLLQLGTGATYATYPGTLFVGGAGISGPEAVGGIEFQTATSASGYGAKIYSSVNDDVLGIATRHNSATWTSRFTVKTTNGNVGIGTAGPANKLHVEGGGGSAGIYLNSAVPSATTYTLYNNAGTLTWNGTPLATGSSVSGTTGRLAKFTGASSVGDSLFSETAGAITLLSNATMTITGQDASSGYSLKLSSGMLATGGTVTAGLFVGSGAGLTGVNAAQIAAGNVTAGTFVSSVNLPAAGVLAGTLGASVLASSIAVGAVNSSNQIVDGTIANADLAGSIDDAKLNTIATAGKVSDSALSSNVALLNANQLISGVKTFSSTATITGQDASGYSLKLSSGMLATGGTITAGLFVGSGAGLTGVTGATDNTKVLKSGDAMNGPLTLNSSTLTVTGAEFSVGTSTFVVKAGSVGIGTTDPSEALVIEGNTTAKARIRINHTGTGGNNYQGLNIYNEGAFKGGVFYNEAGDQMEIWESGANKLTIKSGNVGIATAAPAGLFTVGNGTMVVTAAGNVGIGTASPSERLTISAPGSGYGGLLITGGGSGGIGATVDSGSNNQQLQYRMRRSGSGFDTDWYMYSPASSTDLRFYNGGDKLTFQVGGSVGIGTTSPTNKLHVEGTGAGSAGIYINSAVPSATAYTLYNNAGTLTWNGTPLATGSSVSGTTGRLAKFTGTSSVGDSLLAETAGAITLLSNATMTITGAEFSVGTSTFVVKAGSVGVGVAAPQSMLDVGGQAAFGATTKSTFTAAGVLQLASALAVGYGGTGGTGLTSNTVLLGNGSNPIATTNLGIADQILRIPSAGGAPSFDSIDLSKSAAVGASVLGAVNGGTGLNSISAGQLIYGSGANVFSALAGPASAGQALRASGPGSFAWASLAAADIAESANRWVDVSGDTMSGQLTLAGSSLTVTGAAGVGAPQLRLDPASNIVISSETSGALGGGVRVSTNVYMVGFSSAAKYYGDGSSLTGIAGLLSGGQTPMLPYWTSANALGNSNLSRDSATSLTAVGSTFTVQGSAFSVGGSTFVVAGGNVGIATAAPAGLFTVGNGTMVVTAAGNVGIGTTGPANKLEVASTGGSTWQLDTSNSAYVSVKVGGVEVARMKP